VTKAKELIEEVIEPPVTIPRAGRARKRGLFHDKVLVNKQANQRANIDLM